VQLADPILSVVSPASHFEHLDKSGAPAALAQPIGHNLQPTPKDPAPQSVQLALPDPDVYLPV